MIEQDTIKLLRECDSGIQMGVASIDEVLPHVKSDALQARLERCKTDHEALGRELRDALNRFHDEGKAPNPMAKGMSAFKTHVELAVDPSDATIADLMTDGCNMGVKSLSRYLNQYEAADEAAKDIAKRLIRLEQQLASGIRDYL